MSVKAAPQPRVWPVVLACALCGAAVFQFFGNATRGYIDTASLFYWWGYQWFDAASETEHGLLILAISGWLFWRNLQRAESPELRVESLTSADRTGSSERSVPNSTWAALAAIVGGLGLHALGFAAQQARVSIIALLLFGWGVLRLAGGRRWGRAAAFPLAFMVFAIPLNALDSAGLWLRMWVVDASTGLAHGAGIGVLRSGTQLLAPDGSYNYDVAAACSGVRSLMALAALSLLAGYLNFRSWWRRGSVLLLSFPLVYLGNVVRISAIVFAAQWGGPTWGNRAHEVMGYGVFVIVLGGVLLAIAAWMRLAPERSLESDPPGTARPSGVSPRTAGVSHPIIDKVSVDPAGGAVGQGRLMDDKWRWPTGMIVGLLAVGEMLFLHHLATLPPRGQVGVVLAVDGKNPAVLPVVAGAEWLGRSSAVTPAEREILPPDTGFSRMIYFNRRDPTKAVLLSIVLSGRDRTSIHRPELCLMGQGWTIEGASERRFDFPGRTDAGFPMTLLRVQREVSVPAARGKSPARVVVPQFVAYWFVSGETVVASHWQRLAHDAWNRVVHGRADRWAYVLMQTDAAGGEEAAVARMQAVLRETLPVFQRPLVAR